MAKPPSRPEQPRSEPGLPQSEAVMRADEAWAPASESLGVPQAPRFAVAQREPPAPWLAVLGLLLAALGLGLWAEDPRRAAPALRPLRSRGRAASCPGPHRPTHQGICPARRPAIPPLPPDWRRIPCADGSARDLPRNDGSRKR